MAYTIVELPEENMETAVDENGFEQHVANRTFMVYLDGDTDSGDRLDIALVVLDASLPQINDPHPSIIDLKVKKRSVARMAERTDGYRITYAYEYDPAVDFGTINQVSTTSEITGEFVDVWRTNYFYPFNTNYPPAVDIGGTAIDSAGTPTSTFRRQVSVVMSFDTVTPSLPWLFSFVGRRNALWYRGFGPGTLLYMGCSLSSKSATLSTRTDRFLYDYDYHMRQAINVFDGDLNPKLTSTAVAESVRFVQPFPLLADFEGLGIPNTIG